MLYLSIGQHCIRWSDCVLKIEMAWPVHYSSVQELWRESTNPSIYFPHGKILSACILQSCLWNLGTGCHDLQRLQFWVRGREDIRKSKRYKEKSIRICILLLTLQLVSRDISFRPHEITFTLKKKNGMFIKTSRPAMRVKGNTKGKKSLMIAAYTVMITITWQNVLQKTPFLILRKTAHVHGERYKGAFFSCCLRSLHRAGTKYISSGQGFGPTCALGAGGAGPARTRGLGEGRARPEGPGISCSGSPDTSYLT